MPRILIHRKWHEWFFKQFIIITSHNCSVVVKNLDLVSSSYFVQAFPSVIAWTIFLTKRIQIIYNFINFFGPQRSTFWENYRRLYLTKHGWVDLFKSLKLICDFLVHLVLCLQSKLFHLVSMLPYGDFTFAQNWYGCLISKFNSVFIPMYGIYPYIFLAYKHTIVLTDKLLNFV